MRAKEFRFFRSHLQQWAESLYLQHAIDWQNCQKLQAFAYTPEGKDCAVKLFSQGAADAPSYQLRLHLKQLREIGGGRFYHIEVLPTNPPERPQRVCFVGHRFTPGVENTLRWNLRLVLEPYNISLDWSGMDPRSVQILDDIVQRIGKADFCVFDNRATQGRPNVYIEAGIAYALKRPFLLFEHTPRFVRRRPVIPTDLAHALAFRYRSYKELFRKLYFTLQYSSKETFRKPSGGLERSATMSP